MEFQTKLQDCIRKNNSLLCIGLDSSLEKLPPVLLGQPQAMYEFNKQVIDATADLVCSYKPNTAFYEAEGSYGVEQLYNTCEYIRNNYPHIPVILDAKRADIGNTNLGYAKFAFNYLQADAITLHPYLGREAIEPFLSHKDKGIIILCRTSNPGSGEFQELEIGDKKLYEVVAQKVSSEWNKNRNCLLVVGATYPDELAKVRKLVGDDMIFLVPGVGAQGGDIEGVMQAGLNTDGGGLIISSSRDIIFASCNDDFANVARKRASELRDTINNYRTER